MTDLKKSGRVLIKKKVNTNKLKPDDNDSEYEKELVDIHKNYLEFKQTLLSQGQLGTGYITPPPHAPITVAPARKHKPKKIILTH